MCGVAIVRELDDIRIVEFDIRDTAINNADNMPP